MDRNTVLSQLNLLFVDNDTQVNAEAYALFSPLFKSVTLAHNSVMALQIFSDTETEIDIIMTDIEMPGDDGLIFVDNIRAIDANLPIIVLSAFTDQDYLLRAANLRIDGYLIKPLNFKKLNPVLDKIALRLQYKVSATSLHDHVEYDFLSRSLLVDGTSISLGKKERRLLELLIDQQGLLVPKSTIETTIWHDTVMTDSAIKNLVSELRRKLKYDLVINIPAQGWKLDRREISEE